MAFSMHLLPAFKDLDLLHPLQAVSTKSLLVQVCQAFFYLAADPGGCISQPDDQ